jgi:hypothetical protein
MAQEFPMVEIIHLVKNTCGLHYSPQGGECQKCKATAHYPYHNQSLVAAITTPVPGFEDQGCLTPANPGPYAPRHRT